VRSSGDTERIREELAFGIFAGSLLAVPALGLLLPALGVRAGFLGAGLVVGVCVFLVLVTRIGPWRALLLAVLTTAPAAVVFGLVAFGICVATGCVG
jgi:hypothetical protein